MEGLGGARELRFADKLNNAAEFIGQAMLQNERWEEDQTGEDTRKPKSQLIFEKESLEIVQHKDLLSPV